MRNVDEKLLEMIFDRLCDVELRIMETAKYQEKATQLEQIEEQLVYEKDPEVNRALLVKMRDLYEEKYTMLDMAKIEALLFEEFYTVLDMVKIISALNDDFLENS